MRATAKAVTVERGVFNSTTRVTVKLWLRIAVFMKLMTDDWYRLDYYFFECCRTVAMYCYGFSENDSQVECYATAMTCANLNIMSKLSAITCIIAVP